MWSWWCTILIPRGLGLSRYSSVPASLVSPDGRQSTNGRDTPTTGIFQVVNCLESDDRWLISLVWNVMCPGAKSTRNNPAWTNIIFSANVQLHEFLRGAAEKTVKYKITLAQFWLQNKTSTDPALPQGLGERQSTERLQTCILPTFFWGKTTNSVADQHSKVLDVRPLPRFKCLHFHAELYSEKNGRIIGWRSPSLFGIGALLESPWKYDYEKSWS